MKQRQPFGGFLLLLLAFFMLGMIWMKTPNSFLGNEAMTEQDVMVALENGSIERALILPNAENDTGRLKLWMKSGEQEEVNVLSVSQFASDFQKEGIPYEVNDIPRENSMLNIILPVLLSAAILVAFFMFMNTRNAGGSNAKMMNSGRSRARMTRDSKVNFTNVAGLNEEKEELEEIVDFLKNPQKYTGVGARIPKGVLLVGPPGTGKTSIARSVARALGKKYVRISLGGVHDEAEIRGHRKTYVGAMPGRIVEGLKQAGVKNPLMLLDEIDKVSSDYKGDTASALLEVLDSEQNVKFRDHYVEIPIDLSEVLFIATANTTQTIPGPLLDRMELIEVNSYTENEKFHIGKNYLIRKQMERHGLTKEELSISGSALEKIIHNYTREAGVRNLERRIGDICRKAAREILEDKMNQKAREKAEKQAAREAAVTLIEPLEEEKAEKSRRAKKAVKGTPEEAAGKKTAKVIRVTEKNLEKYLGREKIQYEDANDEDQVGIVRGLAWTSVGGDTLEIEVNVMPGKGALQLTGQMGDVMKESAQTALSYVRSVAENYGIKNSYFEKHDIHIHIPEGAVPKDGPSAGITMATAMMSAVTNRLVSAKTAMTGEVTLRGRVLPIGGLKEKLLAARMAHMEKVLVPAKNRPDVEELSKEITKGMEIVFVKSMDEVLKEAFAD